MLTVLFCFTAEVRILSVCKLSEFQTPTEVGASGIRYPIFTGFLDWQVGRFHRVLHLPPPIKLATTI
jgi:hypothetical protein